ncbi:MAG: hypothetical protein J7518_15080 [Nocardioidaceae bacterium]|nr:hypothetical protein [Nocardioidaceae bacterium]
MVRRTPDPVVPGRYVGALDLTTEVPTPEGTIAVAHLQVGHTVFSGDGQVSSVSEISEPLTGHTCFEVEFATGDRIVADDEQRWFTERRDVPRTVAAPRRRATLELAGSVAEHGPAAFAVRVAPAVQLPTRKLLVEPYLLGAWLGTGADTLPALVGASDALVRNLDEQGVRVFTSGLPRQHWIATPGAARRGANLASRLTALHVLGDKHVPTLYLRASEEQRRELLAGLLDASGAVTHGGEVLFRAPTQALAVGVHELIASLGYRPWRRPGPVRGVDVGFVTADQVFGIEPLRVLHQSRRRLAARLRPRRLVVAVRPVETRPVRRIKLASDDGMLLVGRSFIPVPGATLEPYAEEDSADTA